MLNNRHTDTLQLRRNRNAQRNWSLAGTIVDVTGNLVAVRDKDHQTIRVVSVPDTQLAGLAPGKTVEADGTASGGLIIASEIKITGGSPWPEPSTPSQPSGQIDHILFLIQENHTFDSYFGTYPGAEGFPQGLKVPLATRRYPDHCAISLHPED